MTKEHVVTAALVGVILGFLMLCCVFEPGDWRMLPFGLLNFAALIPICRWALR